MAQIEHGDWTAVEDAGNSEEVTYEAVLRFCPWHLTHMALDHVMQFLQRKLAENWKELEGKTKEHCARTYIGIAQQWHHYGYTTFQAEVFKVVSSQCTKKYRLVEIGCYSNF